MKVNVTKTVTTESIVELNFPCYVKSKSGYHLYKFKSENEIIQIFDGTAGVTFSNYHSSIMNVNMSTALQEGWEFTTEEEYNTMLQIILKSFTL
jgi:vacuolar-type H+-ATPase subunit B/Vma2